MQKVLQQLLREQVSIRDLASHSRDSARYRRRQQDIRCCWSRRRARRWAGRWCGRCLAEDGGLRVVTLDGGIEEELGRAFSPGQAAPVSSALQPSLVRRMLDGLRRLAGEQVAVASPVLFCSTPARFHLKRLLEPFLPKLVVLSPGEIPPVVAVQSIGVLR